MAYLLTNKDNVIVAISSTITKSGKVYTTADNKKFVDTNLTLVSLDAIPENVSAVTHGYTESLGIYEIAKDFEQNLPIGSATEKGLVKSPSVADVNKIINLDNTWKNSPVVNMTTLSQVISSGENKMPTKANLKTFSRYKAFRNVNVLSSNWIGESAPYKNTITVTGVRADKMVVKQPSDNSSDANAIFVETKVYHITNDIDDQIVLYSSELPTTNLSIDIIQF